MGQESGQILLGEVKDATSLSGADSPRPDVDFDLKPIVV
jgi:hypothetical protein